jgi:hypothetical protein
VVTTFKKDGNSQDYKTNVSVWPYWTTTARKTEEKMVGDRNRLLGLLLEWKMTMMMATDKDRLQAIDRPTPSLDVAPRVTKIVAVGARHEDRPADCSSAVK